MSLHRERTPSEWHGMVWHGWEHTPGGDGDAVLQPHGRELPAVHAAADLGEAVGDQHAAEPCEPHTLSCSMRRLSTEHSEMRALYNRMPYGLQGSPLPGLAPQQLGISGSRRRWRDYRCDSGGRIWAVTANDTVCELPDVSAVQDQTQGSCTSSPFRKVRRIIPHLRRT